MVVRWREERAHGAQGDEAIVRAMQTAGRAVVLSGTTVAVGLLALVVLPLPYLRSVGYGGMLIPLVSVAVATTLLPIMLATVGPRLDWPHVRTDDRASRSWTRWARLVVRRRVVAATLAVAVLGALLVIGSALKLGAASGDANAIAQRGDARTGLAALERAGIGAGALTPIEILTRGTDPTRVADAVSRAPGRPGRVRAERRRVAPRRRRARRRRRPRGRHRDARPRPRGGPRRRRRRPRRRASAPRTATSSTPSTAASR